VPLLPSNWTHRPRLWPALRGTLARRPRALVGVPLGDDERGYTNSVAGLSAASGYRYDKYHLVPSASSSDGFRWFRP